MRAGKSDVSAYSPADQRKDDGPFDVRGQYHLFNGHHHRGLRGENHITDHRDHQETKDLSKFIHGLSQIFPKEDDDGDDRADHRARGLIHPEDNVEPQGGSAHVADVEGQPSQRHSKGEKVTQSWQNFIGHILPTQTGNGENAPYVQLDDNVNKNGDEDREGKGGFQLLSKNGGLCDKPGAYGGGRHQKSGS